MAEQSGRGASGRFTAGHAGFKKKGTRHQSIKDLKRSAETVAKKLGGKGGIGAYLEANPKLLNDLLIAAARDKVAAMDAAGNPAAAGFHAGIEQLNIVSIPHNWIVTYLFGAAAHLPSETVARLKELLPDSAFTAPPSTDIDPTLLPLEDASPSRPMLRLLDGDLDPEPPPPAA